ncbi:hypothetical protein M514_04594 [Trichuris suis]|uniref:Ubiquitin-like domain-containing protein n=1 Tax=Trichuris suis TaxID=68888 RepID=A0A085NV14_9BILA|nr:hypothetical protein M514_04594 [Trichuris suis]
MKIKVKSGDGMQEYTVDDEATVGDLKDLIVERHAHPRDRICLIFSGSILKDEEALSGKGITDGITIHMVIRQVFPKAEAPAENSSEPAATDESQPRDDQNPPAQQQQQAQQQQPQNMESFLPFFMIPFQAFENLNELMQRQVEVEYLHTVAAYGSLLICAFSFVKGGQEAPNLQELLENSFMRNLFNQPETIRNMLLSNPQVQRIIEQNPDLGFLLNNPELYRETMNLVRNPAAFQELMRNHDRLVSNIESMPGGMATLQRMYQEIQEPMMNATRDQFGAPNPFASLASDNQGENVSLAGRENRTPLPNPWAPRNERTAQTAPLADSSSLGSGTQLAIRECKTDSTTSAVPQGYENVTLLETLLRNRRFREVFHRMASNGDLRKKLILSTSHEPLSDPDDTTLQERLATVFKERDELRKLGDGLQQPAVFAGLWHILQGIHILMREMPSVFEADRTASRAPSGEADGNTAAISANARNYLGQMLRQLANLNTAHPPTQQQQQPEQQQPTGGDPEVLFSEQLGQLRSMGFVNHQANVQALLMTSGDAEFNEAESCPFLFVHFFKESKSTPPNQPFFLMSIVHPVNAFLRIHIYI